MADVADLILLAEQLILENGEKLFVSKRRWYVLHFISLAIAGVMTAVIL